MTQVETHKVYNIGLKDVVQIFTKDLFTALFSDEERQSKLVEKSFAILCREFSHYFKDSNEQQCFEDFIVQLPHIRTALDEDALAFERNDPACKSLDEIYLAYPGFFAISVYRMAHQFEKMNGPLLPRMMTEYAHSLTGIDIHPGAQIGSSFFIDHGTGIVIGETAIIGNGVSIYQGVTLGGIKVEKKMASKQRHPTIEDNVTIYANATILGDIVIGENTVVGANVWITQPIPANSIVSYQTQIKVKTKNEY